MDQMLRRSATPGEEVLMQNNTVLFQENCFRSQNEQALYAAWKNAVEENSNLNKRNAIKVNVNKKEAPGFDLITGEILKQLPKKKP